MPRLGTWSSAVADATGSRSSTARLPPKSHREGAVRRDWRFVLSVIGVALTCLACLTPLAVLALGAIGLGAWTGRLDLVLVPLLLGFVALAVYRYRIMRRRAR